MIRPTRGLTSLTWRRYYKTRRDPKTTWKDAGVAPADRPPGPYRAPKAKPPPEVYDVHPVRVPKDYKQTKRRSASSEPPTPDTVLTLWKTSWLPLTGAALLAGFLGFYIVGTFTASLKQTPCSCHDDATPTGRPSALTGDNAEQFDKELNWPEWWMGITKLRRRIAERAKGDVLELAMGSGRNLEYYNWDALTAAAQREQMRAGITSFTGLDISVDMLDVARRKLTKTVPPMAGHAPIVKASTMVDHTGGQLSYLDNHLRFIHSDAHHQLPLTSTAKKYDTVIQTFGLCSVSDPVAVLSNLATAVKPETGRIILLEHGKGWLGLVNGLLDRNAGKHFEKYGCWWNRDIEALVEQAAGKTPGLQVVAIERPNISQMGTLVWVELKVTQKDP